jgi:glycosyltransferase involved in cell wall biosynthesis
MGLQSIIALLVLLYWLAMLWELGRYGRRMDRLKASPAESALRHSRTPGRPDSFPYVSIIIAAKEEERSITDTVKHLLDQSYPRYEIIAVNDRSADRTGAKLDELKRWSERGTNVHVPLKVVHITSLPEGWLGKNHALYQGYLQARGQLVLFTDADVRFQRDALSAAVDYMTKQEADHVTAVPFMTAKGFWLRGFVQYFLFSLSLFTRPWRANDDESRKHGTGIGAFNLLTRRAYEAIGTHRAFAMRPDDDLRLGARVKQAGFRQRIVTALNLLEVEWYPTLRSAITGLEKNLFSGFGYRLPLAIGAMLGQLLCFVLPFLGIWTAGGWASAAFAASIAAMLGLYVRTIRRMSRYSGIEAVVLPITALLLVYVLARSVTLTLLRKGVYWRGTFYSLDELRKMR